jgi:hypothetical protein
VGPDEDSTLPAEEQKHGAAAKRGCRPRGRPQGTPLSAEGMRTAFRCAASGTALLQRGMPARRTALVALESAAELSSDGGGQRQAQRTEQAVPRTGQKPPTSNGRRGGSGDHEGNPQRFFSTIVATGRAATRDSSRNGDRHTSATVRAHAGAPWNESGNESGAGAAQGGGNGRVERTMTPISRTY